MKDHGKTYKFYLNKYCLMEVLNTAILGFLNYLGRCKSFHHSRSDHFADISSEDEQLLIKPVL
jgi:hypothetical protein